MRESEITREWLMEKGFADFQPMVGYVRKCADGPDDSACSIFVCITPWNGKGVMVYVGNFGVLTNATSRDDIEQLIRLLDGGRIDHPYRE